MLNQDSILLNQELEKVLLKSGFCDYSIDEIKDSKAKVEIEQQVSNYLKQLFTAKPTPLATPKDKRKKLKKEEKAPEVQPQPTHVSSKFLSKLAFGLIEEVSPAQVLNMCNTFFSEMTKPQKLAYIYLVKEFIRQDINKEWIESTRFNSNYNKLLLKLEKDPELAAVKLALEQFFLSNVQASHLRSSMRLATDLTRSFSEAILNMSAVEFRSEALFSKEEVSTPFLKLSALTSNLSRLVCYDVLKSKSPKVAASRILYYLDVIDHCLNEKTINSNPRLTMNIAAAFAIFNGLQFNVVSRLTALRELLSSNAQKQMEYYQKRFSPKGGFAGIRQLMTEHPACIPTVAIYSGDKEKIQSNSLQDRIILNGKLNKKFLEHKTHLQQFACLFEQPYSTDLKERLEKLARYSDDDFDKLSYKASYSLEPPKIIKLEGNLTSESLLLTLKDCLVMEAPLAVQRATGKILVQNEAKAELASFLKMEDDAVWELCDKVIIKFDKLGTKKASLSEAEPSSLDSLVEGIQRISLTESSSATPTRARSQTQVTFSLTSQSAKQKRSAQEKRNLLTSQRFTTTRIDLRDPQSQRVEYIPHASSSYTPLQEGQSEKLKKEKSATKSKATSSDAKEKLSMSTGLK